MAPVRVKFWPALAALLGVTTLAGAPAALANSSGGAAMVPQHAPKGIVSTSASAAVFTRTLRRGDSGADVKTLQTWLSEVGYSVSIDGAFGPLTQAAVRGFQRDHHLSPVTGVVGPQDRGRVAVRRQAGRQERRAEVLRRSHEHHHEQPGVPAQAAQPRARTEQLVARPGNRYPDRRGRLRLAGDRGRDDLGDDRPGGDRWLRPLTPRS